MPPGPASLGAADREIDVFTIEALFTTVTNVDFDPERIQGWLVRAAEIKAKAKKLYEDAAAKAGKTPETLTGPAAWEPAATIEGLVAQGHEIGLEARKAALGDDVVGLQEIITYGLKGAAAYADHAQILGQEER